MSGQNYSDMRVVLIDDDALVLKTLVSALEDLGVSVTPFEDPLKGLDWIAKNGADIVISDICMPNCDGFDVLKRVKELDDRCDVIFITAHGQMETAIRALREGATDFFEKPLTATMLHAAMERTSRYRHLFQQNTILSNKINILSDELIASNSRDVMLGQSVAMKKIAEDIVDIAQSNATVLILGESGTGKELVSRAIHVSSARRDKPLLTLNCPSIPEDLFESEMFGHRRGAFTGAIETRSGYVEAAEGGTLFMDEIGDLPIKSQAKILRLLEQKTYQPVGEHKERNADVRIIAATNQSLEQRVKDKTFREDLFYRLNVCTISIPPLRERKDDIPLLALFFTMNFTAEMGKPIEGINDEALRVLTNHKFPGNVRELRNIIESSVIHCKHSGPLTVDDLSQIQDAQTTGDDGDVEWPMDTMNLEDVEKRLYTEALARTGDNVSAAARMLGLSRGKLRRRLAALGIQDESDEPC